MPTHVQVGVGPGESVESDEEVTKVLRHRVHKVLVFALLHAVFDRDRVAQYDGGEGRPALRHEREGGVGVVRAPEDADDVGAAGAEVGVVLGDADPLEGGRVRGAPRVRLRVHQRSQPPPALLLHRRPLDDVTCIEPAPHARRSVHLARHIQIDVAGEAGDRDRDLTMGLATRPDLEAVVSEVVGGYGTRLLHPLQQQRQRPVALALAVQCGENLEPRGVGGGGADGSEEGAWPLQYTYRRWFSVSE